MNLRSKILTAAICLIAATGLFATTTNIKDNEVTLKVDESSNTRLRVLKSTIVRILPKESEMDVSKPS